MENRSADCVVCAGIKAAALSSKISNAFVAVAFIAGSLTTIPAFAAGPPRPPDPCNKELSVNDVQGILTGKATINHYSMSESKPGEGCSIGVVGKGWAFVDISIRHGDKQSYQNRIFFVPPSRKSVAGIGEEAIVTLTTSSNIPNAKETDLFARKGGQQCIVQLHRSNGDGERLVVPTTDRAIATKLGGLCNKLF